MWLVKLQIKYSNCDPLLPYQYKWFIILGIKYIYDLGRKFIDKYLYKLQ